MAEQPTLFNLKQNVLIISFPNIDENKSITGIKVKMPSKFSNFRIRAINCLGSSEPTYEICANQPVVGIPHNFTDINKIAIDPEEIVHF